LTRQEGEIGQDAGRELSKLADWPTLLG
jgi:hypothetical protein